MQKTRRKSSLPTSAEFNFSCWSRVTSVGAGVCVSHLEVAGIHSQGEGVLLAEVQQPGDHVVDVLVGLLDSFHHQLPMLLHLRAVVSKILKVGEVGLGLGVRREQPAESERRAMTSQDNKHSTY